MEKGYVDESYGMVMMPAVVKGTESGIKALALVTLDLESSGEHWGTTFLTPGGPLVQGTCRAYRGAEACHQGILYSLRLLVHTPCGT